MNVAALATDQDHLYFAAAAVDAAESGQDLTDGQILPEILSLAQAVFAGISGAVGTPAAGVPAAAHSAGDQRRRSRRGGVYGIVQPTKNWNAAGILGDALEAAAVAAAGFGLVPDTQRQTLNAVATALGAARVASNIAGSLT